MLVLVLIFLSCFLCVSFLFLLIHLLHHFTCSTADDAHKSHRALPRSLLGDIFRSCLDILDPCVCIRTKGDIGGPFPWILGLQMFLSSTILLSFLVINSTNQLSHLITPLIWISWLFLLSLESSFATIRRSAAIGLTRTFSGDSALRDSSLILLGIWILFCAVIAAEVSLGDALMATPCSARFLGTVFTSILFLHSGWTCFCTVRFYMIIYESFRKTLAAIDEEMFRDEVRPIQINTSLCFVAGTMAPLTMGVAYLWTCGRAENSSFFIFISYLLLNNILYGLCFGRNRRIFVKNCITACFSSSIEDPTGPSPRLMDPRGGSEPSPVIPDIPVLDESHLSPMTDEKQESRQNSVRSVLKTVGENDMIDEGSIKVEVAPITIRQPSTGSSKHKPRWTPTSLEFSTFLGHFNIKTFDSPFASPQTTMRSRSLNANIGNMDIGVLQNAVSLLEEAETLGISDSPTTRGNIDFLKSTVHSLTNAKGLFSPTVNDGSKQMSTLPVVQSSGNVLDGMADLIASEKQDGEDKDEIKG